MASIRERKKQDGTTVYHCQVRMAGYPARTASFTTLAKARKWVTTVEADMIEGRHFKNAAGRRRTVAEAAVKYAREILHIDALPEYEPSPDYEKRLDTFLAAKWVQPTHPDAPADARNSLARLMWWRKELGGVKVGAVTSELIEEKLSRLRTEPYQRSKPGQKNSVVHGKPPRLLYRTEKTVNRYIAAGSKLFRIAWKRWHWINANPFGDIERAEESGGRLKVLTAKQRAKLFEALLSDRPLFVFSVTARASVVRSGDLQKLRKADVEFTVTQRDGHAKDAEEVVGRLAIRQPKNKEPRIVWIAGEPAQILRDYIASTDPEEPRVFVSAKGRLYRYHQGFVAACKRAQIEGFTFHGWRHDGATDLARMGASEQQLRLIGGWKSNVVRKYVHIAAEDAKELVTTMNKKILG